MSTAAEEGQVVDDGDVYEMAGLLDHPGNGFKVTASMFGDENFRGALGRGRRVIAGVERMHSP